MSDRAIPLSDLVLRSQLIGQIPGIRHGMTGRNPGMGIADGNVGYSRPRNRRDAWAMRQQWARAAGLEPRQMVCVYQEHGNAVYAATTADAGRGASSVPTLPAHADAIITNEPGVVLTTLHADCMPILIADPVTRSVATIHAGWRGTTLDVAGATVAALAARYGALPSDLRCFLGPAIGVCCYEVGPDVRQAWRETEMPEGSAPFVDAGDRWHFDLVAANRELLQRAGVPEAQIEVAGICTRCHGDRWFSHRGQGPLTGRFASMIALVGEGA